MAVTVLLSDAQRNDAIAQPATGTATATATATVNSLLPAADPYQHDHQGLPLADHLLIEREHVEPPRKPKRKRRRFYFQRDSLNKRNFIGNDGSRRRNRHDNNALANHPLAFLDPTDLAPPGYNNELSTFHFVYDPVLDVLCTAFADRKFSIGAGKKKKQRRTKRADGKGNVKDNGNTNGNGNGSDNDNVNNRNDNGIDVGDGSLNDNDCLADAPRKASVPRELRKRLRKCHPEEIVRKFEGELISFLGGLQLDRKECIRDTDSTCTSATGKGTSTASSPDHHARNRSDEWVVVHEVNESDFSQINAEGVVLVGKEDHSDLRVSVVSGGDHRPFQEKPPRAVGIGEGSGEAKAEKRTFLVWEVGDCFSRWVVHKMCGYYHLLSFSRNAEGGRRLTYVYHPAYAPEEVLRRERIKGRNTRFVWPEKSFFEYLFP